MPRLDIVNGTVVDGTGRGFMERTSIIVEDGFIRDVPRVPYVAYNAKADNVIDAHGDLIIPGLINTHFHGGSTGPFFPYAWDALSIDRLLLNLDSHLLQGTTTVLNCDGLALPSEVEMASKLHPINIRACTLHTPKNLRAAEVSAGDGIKGRHRGFTAKQAVREGAIGLGEIGSPGTTFGTAEKIKRLGKTISPPQALALNNAVIGKKDEELRKALNEAGLQNLSIDEAKKLVEETSLLPIQASCDAILESVEYVPMLGVPALVHTSKETKEAALRAAKVLGSKMVALHVNHTFGAEEAVELAKELKRYGTFVEVITGDPHGARQLHQTPEVDYALFREGLVDEISTDFSGGYHDSILMTVKKAVEEGVLTLPHGIKMATGTPASMVPGIAPQRGTIAPDMIADICVVDVDDISKVKTVIIAGRVVVCDGELVFGERHRE